MKTDSKDDSVTDRLAQVVRDYTPRHPSKFQRLLPMKQGIADLRSKGASYAAIAGILRNINVPVATDTICRFCHEVLGEPMTRRRKRRKVTVAGPKKLVHEEPREGRTGGTVSNTESKPFHTWRRPDGPRIADPNNI